MKKMKILLSGITLLSILLFSIILIFIRGEHKIEKMSEAEMAGLTSYEEMQASTKKFLQESEPLDREYVISVIGEPNGYLWGNSTFEPDELPEYYIMDYGDGSFVCIYHGILAETRVHKVCDFKDFNGIGFGDTIDEVIEKIGKPTRVVEDGTINYEDNVLFLKRPSSYYSVPDKHVRLFFRGEKVISIYNTGNFTKEFLSYFSNYGNKK